MSRRRPVIWVCTAAMALVGQQLLSSTSSKIEVERTFNSMDFDRLVSIALPNGGCEFTWPELSKAQIEQTFAASFPGSGARLTRNLIEGITGIVAASDKNFRKYNNREVAIKTHYPHRAGRDIHGAQDVSRGLLLLRNPKFAIPSFHNFKFEMQNDLPNHSVRAPVNDWLKWRTDGQFDRQLSHWEEFVVYWMTKLESEKRLILSYENLISQDTGPEEATRLRNFLSEVDGVDGLDSGAIPCLWNKLVNYKEDKSVNIGGKRDGPSEKPFTRRQLDAFETSFERLKGRFVDDEILVSILEDYLEEIRNTEANEAHFDENGHLVTNPSDEVEQEPVEIEARES